jgi:Fur family zinc uptake transcriptional regulator
MGKLRAIAFRSDRHDHEACIGTALDRAARLCARRGVRLTPLRRRVLELVWRGHAPVGAYDILALLSAETGPVAPPTVYRALEFLQAHGLVHRIESLNAYFGCERPDAAHGGQFLLCTECGAAAELDRGDIADAARRAAERLGFVVERQTIELRGRCPRCRENDAR